MTFDFSVSTVFFLFAITFLIQKSLLLAPLRGFLWNSSLSLKIKEFDKLALVLDKFIYMLNCGFCLSFWTNLLFLTSFVDMASIGDIMNSVQESLTYAGAVSVLVVLYSFLVKKVKNTQKDEVIKKGD